MHMKAEEKIYKAFYDTREKQLYFNQLKELTNLSNSSLQNALQKLENSKLVEIIQTKSNTFYQLKNRHLTALEFSGFDIEKFNNLNRNVKMPLKEYLKMSPNYIQFIILFGSACRKRERKSSDIDLLVVINKFKEQRLQKMYLKEIIEQFENISKNVRAISIHPINTVFATIDEFKYGKDHLVNQAKLTGFPIKNHQNYHEVMHNED